MQPDEYSIRGLLAVSLRRSQPLFMCQRASKLITRPGHAMLHHRRFHQRFHQRQGMDGLIQRRAYHSLSQPEADTREFIATSARHSARFVRKMTAAPPLTRPATSVNKVQLLACRKKSFRRLCRMTASLLSYTSHPATLDPFDKSPGSENRESFSTSCPRSEFLQFRFSVVSWSER